MSKPHTMLARGDQGEFLIYINGELRGKYATAEMMHVHFAECLAECDRLKAFKAYVHKRLGKMNVPHDPDVERTENTGCRIGSRLNHIATVVEEIESIRDDMWISVDDSEWSDETKRVVGDYAKRLVDAMRMTSG